MSRLVRPDATIDGRVSFTSSPVTVVDGTSGAPAARDDQAGLQERQVDDLSTRIVKYIPSEVIAFYLAADKPGSPAMPSGNDSAVATDLVGIGATYPWNAGLAVVLIALFATPLFYRFQAEDQPWAVNAVVATLEHRPGYRIQDDAPGPCFASAFPKAGETTFRADALAFVI